MLGHFRPFGGKAQRTCDGGEDRRDGDVHLLGDWHGRGEELPEGDAARNGEACCGSGEWQRAAICLGGEDMRRIVGGSAGGCRTSSLGDCGV